MTPQPDINSSDNYESHSHDSENNVNFSLSINDVSRRLSTIESILIKSSQLPSKTTPIIEIFKILLGSWPVFGFLFLLLFYTSTLEILKVLPKKISSVKEFTVPGVSFKLTIDDFANELGVESLSTTIPKLSPAALRCLLMQSQYGHSGLTTVFGREEDNFTNRVSFPTQETINAFYELKSYGLVKINSSGWKSTPLETYKGIETFKHTYPGIDKMADNSAQQIWEFNKNEIISDLMKNIPDLVWETTPLGSQAVEIIVQAIAKELAGKDEHRMKNSELQKM